MKTRKENNMKIKLIEFGGKTPERNHYNDAGADVFAYIKNHKIDIKGGEIKKIPLGFGLRLPDGFVGFVLPRSGMTSNYGITTEVVPIDSGYTGEIHAIVHNTNKGVYTISNGDKIAQLVIVPTVLADFVKDEEPLEERGNKGFGSSGK
jgi:dUTP pyrophosphatase